MMVLHSMPDGRAGNVGRPRHAGALANPEKMVEKHGREDRFVAPPTGGILRTVGRNKRRALRPTCREAAVPPSGPRFAQYPAALRIGCGSGAATPLGRSNMPLGSVSS